METIETFKVTYQSFIKSNLTAKAFCEQNGIAKSHFFYWQSKLRRAAMSRASSSTADGSGFLPVSLNNRSGKIVLVGGHSQHGVRSAVPPSPATCEISYPNGVTVRLSGEVSASMLGQLITLDR